MNSSSTIVLEENNTLNRLSMAKINSIKTLHQSVHSNRAISRILGVDWGEVNRYVRDLKTREAQKRPNPQTGCGEKSAGDLATGPSESSRPVIVIGMYTILGGMSLRTFPQKSPSRRSSPCPHFPLWLATYYGVLNRDSSITEMADMASEAVEERCWILRIIEGKNALWGSSPGELRTSSTSGRAKLLSIPKSSL